MFGDRVVFWSCCWRYLYFFMRFFIIWLMLVKFVLRFRLSRCLWVVGVCMMVNLIVFFLFVCFCCILMFWRIIVNIMLYICWSCLVLCWIFVRRLEILLKVYICLINFLLCDFVLVVIVVLVRLMFKVLVYFLYECVMFFRIFRIGMNCDVLVLKMFLFKGFLNIFNKSVRLVVSSWSFLVVWLSEFSWFLIFNFKLMRMVIVEMIFIVDMVRFVCWRWLFL